jgi:hypothetical protein
MNLKDKNLLKTAVVIFKGYDSPISLANCYMGNGGAILSSRHLSIHLKLPSLTVETLTQSRFFKFDLSKFAEFLDKNKLGEKDDKVLINTPQSGVGLIDFKVQGKILSTNKSFAGKVVSEADAKWNFKIGEEIGYFDQEDLKHLVMAYKFSASKRLPLSKRNDFSTILLKDNHLYSTDKFYGFKSPVFKSKLGFSISIPDRAVPLIALDGGGFSIFNQEQNKSYELKGSNYQILYPKSIYYDLLDMPFKPMNLMETVFVDRKELIDSLRVITKFLNRFNADSASKDLVVSIDKTLQLKPTNDANSVCCIEEFRKMFDDDLTITTDGSRLLRIIENIQSQTVELKIPRSNEGLIVNDSYCLMSWIS